MKINREVATGKKITVSGCQVIVAEAKPDTKNSFNTVREFWFSGKAKDFKKAWKKMEEKLRK